MENEQENIDSTNDTETTENIDIDLSEGDDENEGEETITIPKSKWTEVLAQKDHWKRKATNKTGENKGNQPKEEPVDMVSQLSAKDALLLAKADVDIEDVDEVVDFAKYRKISIADAVKNPTLRAIINDRKEERLTAIATQTKNSKPTVKVSDNDLLERARKGEAKEEDIEKIVRAQWESKLKK